jgi:bifunctional non-homologous end joining protein LigD
VPTSRKSPTVQALLDKYQEKRDFGRTPEPPPGAASGEGALMFVVQKHGAAAAL